VKLPALSQDNLVSSLFRISIERKYTLAALGFVDATFVRVLT